MAHVSVKDILAESLRGGGKDYKFIILHESWWQSFAKDFTTFGMIAGMTLLNHALGWDSWVVDGFAAFAVMTFLLRSDERAFRVTTAELVDMVRRMDKERT